MKKQENFNNKNLLTCSDFLLLIPTACEISSLIQKEIDQQFSSLKIRPYFIRVQTSKKSIESSESERSTLCEVFKRAITSHQNDLLLVIVAHKQKVSFRLTSLFDLSMNF